MYVKRGVTTFDFVPGCFHSPGVGSHHSALSLLTGYYDTPVQYPLQFLPLPLGEDRISYPSGSTCFLVRSSLVLSHVLVIGQVSILLSVMYSCNARILCLTDLMLTRAIWSDDLPLWFPQGRQQRLLFCFSCNVSWILVLVFRISVMIL